MSDHHLSKLGRIQKLAERLSKSTFPTLYSRHSTSAIGLLCKLCCRGPLQLFRPLDLFWRKFLVILVICKSPPWIRHQAEWYNRGMVCHFKTFTKTFYFLVNELHMLVFVYCIANVVNNSCLLTTQTLIGDCSFVASLAISADYEKRFKTRLITRWFICTQRMYICDAVWQNQSYVWTL